MKLDLFQLIRCVDIVKMGFSYNRVSFYFIKRESKLMTYYLTKFVRFIIDYSPITTPV